MKMILAQLGILAASPSSAESPGLISFAPFILIFVVFYFLVFAPMRKKQKLHEEMLHKLCAGDRVITNGGIHGTVVGVSDGIVHLRVADNIKIELSKSAVAALQNPDQ